MAPVIWSGRSQPALDFEQCETCRKVRSERNMRLFKAVTNSRRKSGVSINEYQYPQKAPVAVSIRSDMSDSRGSLTSFSAISSSGPRSTTSEAQSRFVRRPNLSQILADQAPAPWTLEAFTAFAERNMCLENIEFIQDAERYRQAYSAVTDRDKHRSRSVGSRDDAPALSRMDSAQTETLKEMWTRIMLLYIAASSPKELNLSSNIRAQLIPHNKSPVPPSPHLLDPAVNKIYELIEDSILFSFLNEVNMSYQPSVSSRDDLGLDATAADRTAHPAAEITEHQSASLPASAAKSPKLGAFSFSKTRSKTGSSSSKHGSTTSRPPSIAAVSSAEDAGSAVLSPATSRDAGGSPPPRTPPPNVSDPSDSKKLSPKPRKDASWKRMSARFGFSRKNGTSLRDVLEDHLPDGEQ